MLHNMSPVHKLCKYTYLGLMAMEVSQLPLAGEKWSTGWAT